MNEQTKETIEEVATVAETLLPPEIRVFYSLAVKLGMEVPDIIALFHQHGVTDAQIKEADLQNEIDVYQRAEQLKNGG